MNKINIKPENRGKFTRWAKHHGMSVSQATSKILSNKDNYSSGVVKMANFSRNFGGNSMGGYVVPKHWVGAVIGAATSILGTLQARQQQKKAEELARTQRNGVLLEEDKNIFDKYPTTGNDIGGYYDEGGKIPTLKKEVRIGTEVEQEHKATYNFIKKHIKDTGKIPSMKKVAKSIAVDHIKDYKKANNGDDPSYYKGLIEEGLSDEKSKYKSNGGKLMPSNSTLEAIRQAAKGGLVGYNTVGGDLVPISDNMDKVKGNTHEENAIDNTNGVKLMDGSGRPVAEVEDQEVIKDDKKVYSDRLKLPNGRTYAEEAERIAKKISSADSILNDPNSGYRKKNVAKIQKQNWEKASEDLFQNQEEMKEKKGIKDNDQMLPKGAEGFDISKLVPYADNVVNALLTATTPKPSFPMLARPRKLETSYNINPQLQNVTDTVNQVTEGINRGTSNSNVAQQRTNAVRLAGMKSKGELYGQKENIETGLKNQETLNNQQIEGQNLARISGYTDAMTNRAYNMQGRLSANVANAVEDYNGAEQAKAMEAYQDEQINILNKMYNQGGSSMRADASIALQKDANGQYLYPRLAARFKELYPDYTE